MKNYKKSQEEKPQYEHFNKKEIVDKLVPLVENTAMRFGVIPVDLELLLIVMVQLIFRRKITAGS